MSLNGGGDDVIRRANYFSNIFFNEQIISIDKKRQSIKNL